MPKCEVCGDEFTPCYPNMGGERTQRFCSRSCRDRYWRTTYKGRARDIAEVIPKPQPKKDNGRDIISGIKYLMGNDHLIPSGPVIHYRPGDPGFNELARQYAR